MKWLFRPIPPPSDSAMVVDRFPLSTAQIVALFVESVFYGWDYVLGHLPTGHEVNTLLTSQFRFHADAGSKVLTDWFAGMFLITFFHCLRVLLWEDGHIKSWRRLHWKMVIASLLMFSFASLDIAFGLRHNIEAFVYFQGGAIEDFEKLSYWVNVMKMVDYVGQTFVGDAILVGSPSVGPGEVLRLIQWSFS